MRLSFGLTCLAMGAMSLALADPPGDPPAQNTVVEPKAQTATAAAPASATTSVDPEEKRLIAQGYKVRMRNGERVFCRREEVLGSRLEGRLICGTIADLKAAQEQTRQELEKHQRIGVTDAK